MPINFFNVSFYVSKFYTNRLQIFCSAQIAKIVLNSEIDSNKKNNASLWIKLVSTCDGITRAGLSHEERKF